eukprot:scaffold139508_cov62-Attheya_sp.AAC.1
MRDLLLRTQYELKASWQPFLKKSHDVSPIQSHSNPFEGLSVATGMDWDWDYTNLVLVEREPRFWSRGVESIENRREASENRNGAKIGRRRREQSALRLRNDGL